MKTIVLKGSDDKLYDFEVTGRKEKHFGVDDIYAIAVFYTGCIIYNLDFNPANNKKTIILTD